MSAPSQQVRLTVSLEETAARLFADDIMAMLEDDGLPVSLFEQEQHPGNWTISIYAPEEQADDILSRLDRLEIQSKLKKDGNPVGWQIEPIENIDWVSRSLKDLSPIRVGRFVVHGSHDSTTPKPNEYSIQIDAGQAFGTGHHGTTAACLELIDRCFIKRRYSNILDLGTGSAVLAIAMAKGQHGRILATDIDPIAIEVARKNVQLNGTHGQITCQTADGLNHRIFRQSGKFDLIVANILAKPLERLAPSIASMVERSGTVILSGLLPHQKPRIINAYRSQGLRFQKSIERDGWLAALFVR